MKLLVIEDEEELLADIVEGLRLLGYAVDSSSDGEEGYYLTTINTYDLLILDLNLPHMDGIQILQKVRKTNPDIKILILSARINLASRIEGLDLGANDYLTKPFYFAELSARIRSLLRRQFVTQSKCLCCGNIHLDTNAQTVCIGTTPLHLSPKEYGILHYLLNHQDQVIRQEELIEHVWDERADLFSTSIRVHVSNLRKKLSPFLAADTGLLTVPARGYLLTAQRSHYDENFS